MSHVDLSMITDKITDNSNYITRATNDKTRVTKDKTGAIECLTGATRDETRDLIL